MSHAIDVPCFDFYWHSLSYIRLKHRWVQKVVWSQIVIECLQRPCGLMIMTASASVCRWVFWFVIGCHIPNKILLDFFNGLNFVYPNLKFTMEILYISIQFLDFTISKGFSFLLRGLLSTSIYFEHITTFWYLHGGSYIAAHVLKGIAVDKIVRTLRIILFRMF